MLLTKIQIKWQIRNVSHEKPWMWLKKGNFKRETQSLLIAAQPTLLGPIIAKQEWIGRNKTKTKKIMLWETPNDQLHKRMQQISSERV